MSRVQPSPPAEGGDRTRRRRRTLRRPGGRPPTGVPSPVTAEGRAGRGPEWPYLVLLVAPWLLYAGTILLARVWPCLLCTPMPH